MTLSYYHVTATGRKKLRTRAAARKVFMCWATNQCWLPEIAAQVWDDMHAADAPDNRQRIAQAANAVAIICKGQLRVYRV